MTHAQNLQPASPENAAASTSTAPAAPTTAPAPETGTLPGLADSAALLRVRIRPAELARMLGVSRQAVSTWVKKGYFSPGIDGRVDPQQAVAEVLRRTPASQLRAQVLKRAVEDVKSLRESAAAADARADRLQGRVAHLEAALAEARAEADLADRMNGEFMRLLDARRAEFCATAKADLDDWFMALLDDALAGALASIDAERAAARQAAIDADTTGLAAVDDALADLGGDDLPDLGID